MLAGSEQRGVIPMNLAALLKMKLIKVLGWTLRAHLLVLIGRRRWRALPALAVTGLRMDL